MTKPAKWCIVTYELDGTKIVCEVRGANVIEHGKDGYVLLNPLVSDSKLVSEKVLIR